MIAGIDLGGTQVRVALAEDDGEIVHSDKTRTGLLKTPQAMVDWTAAAIHRRLGRKKLRAVAIGAPGPIDTTRGILSNPPNLPGWQNSPLERMLRDALGCPAHLENDANLAGVGEYHRGAGRGSRNMVYITWSTGVGGGLIVNGQLLSGSHGSAGEVGHMIIDPDGPLDGCGQRGCLEVFTGGRQMQAHTGESAAEIFAAAEEGDHEAKAIVDRAAYYMGLALINVTNLIDPDIIVIGGGVTRSWKLVAPTLEQVLRSSPFIRPERRPKIRRAALGDRAGQVGAVEWARLSL
ncbi:MAG TPA: ROK family protein [Candidatus Dormibacteraeota bacterium]